MTDFEADIPFEMVSKRLVEHYGFVLCAEVIRKTTLHHARKIKAFMTKAQNLPFEDVKQLVAEADGGMIPMASMRAWAGDKRKSRKVFWKEARLCFSREINSAKAHFRATLGPTEHLGDMWFSSAVEAGMG